jgi:hypothetical protein
LQNVSGNHAATWQQKLAVDFLLLFGKYLFALNVSTKMPVDQMVFEQKNGTGIFGNLVLLQTGYHFE